MDMGGMMRRLFQNNWFVGTATGAFGNALWLLIQLHWPSSDQLSGASKLWTPLTQTVPIPTWSCLLVAGYLLVAIVKSIVALFRAKKSTYSPSNLEQAIVRVIRFYDGSVFENQISKAIHSIAAFANVGHEGVRVAIENLCDKGWLDVDLGWQELLYYRLTAVSMAYADAKGWEPNPQTPRS